VSLRLGGNKRKMAEMKTTSKESAKDTLSVGSALIIAVILTSLLAIIGVMFVMMARVDRMATSAISENKELNSAVEAVVALVSQELVLDVPGVAGQEYYDYPDANNAWLASLEPYEKTTGNYYWRQISDVTGFLNVKNFATQDVNVDPPGTRKYIQEYPEITLDASGELKELWADADGDGIADSKWIEVNDITSNKGKPIYAAIRVVDNGGMLNVNTAYKFDPNEKDSNLIDGSSQTQINLFALSKRGSTSNPLGKLDDARFGSEPLPHNLDYYIRDVVWRYNEPNGTYTPFDIGDELELHYRFLLNHPDIDARLEEMWDNAFQVGKQVPFDSDIPDWFKRAQYDFSEPNKYSYRHIGTIYNMDRIIDPDCNKMANVNTADVNALYKSIRRGLLDANYPDANIAAQIAVDINDYRDNDSNVTVYLNPDDGKKYYGFERPCIYISELAYRFRQLAESGPLGYTLRRSYAIELYKPSTDDNYPEPNQWRLSVGNCPNSPFYLNWSGTQHFHVVCLDDSCEPISPLVSFELGDNDPKFTPSVEVNTITYNTIVTSVSLERYTDAGWISVDSVPVPLPSWLITLNQGTRSFKRDITLHKCIRRLWDTSGSTMSNPSPGQTNPSYAFSESPDILIQAHPEDKLFTNIGEIGMVFLKSAYSQGPNSIGNTDTEATARLNIADPNFQQVFNYLTVFDPCDFHPGDPNYVNETRIKGRININTAPWFVLAQLPWVSQRIGGTDYSLAQALVAYRDKQDLSTSGGPDYYRGGASNSKELETGLSGISEANGFRSIGELMNVINISGKKNYDIRYYSLDSSDQVGFPDLDPNEGVVDDFKERDVIFARISDLVTVRSDVFTAYILVRIGTDGPQKRVMAILDRSDVYPGGIGKVKVRAVHPIPDPR
jgi:hypothetical protein